MHVVQKSKSVAVEEEPSPQDPGSLRERKHEFALREIESAAWDLFCVVGFDRATVEEISRNVSFDAYAWLLTDPETEVGCDPVADVPCMPQLPTLIRLKYATETNRWTSMSRSAWCAISAITMQ